MLRHARSRAKLGIISLSFFVSVTLPRALFLRGRPRGAECTSCWKPFVGARAHQPHVRGHHRVTTSLDFQIGLK